MRALVADKFEKSGLEGLRDIGCEVLSQPDLSGDALLAAIAAQKPEILIVRSTKVDASMIMDSSVKLIVRAGAGYNTIDVAAATSNGIYVSNCPGKNSHAVAELAFGLIIALDRFIPDNVADFRNGKWNKKEYSKAKGLFGSTLGLVGMGQIGIEMVVRAKAFGMHVVGYSKWMTTVDADHLGIELASSLEDLAARSDVISVHASLRAETRTMLGKEFFDSMKQGATFVNTSRGEVVEQAALVEAVKSGRIRVGLDVFQDEPTEGVGVYDGPLKDLPGVYITHHIGASTDQAQEAVAAETVRIVKEFMHSGIAPNAVNTPVH